MVVFAEVGGGSVGEETAETPAATGRAAGEVDTGGELTAGGGQVRVFRDRITIGSRGGLGLRIAQGAE